MDTRIKEWEKLKYIDPAITLPKLYQLQIEISQSNLDQKVKELRTRTLKPNLEKRTAAIFCYGMSCLLKNKIVFAAAPRQNADYDIITRCIQNNAINYVPIQIKEVIPERTNPTSSLSQIIENLKKYPDSKETVVVIHSNRTGQLAIEDIKVPNLNIAALWILGASVADQSKWFIAGNLLQDNAKIYEFPYPR